ncbi:Serine/threonine-protein kinase AfsK [Actinomadura rubteroloni]|uniref:Serine/threonine-protein kinase AfsK n=1 Tax=Actinomadura rubteroloni TaxID=1926885 RepID=A0A2P4UC47_9ACTN|nr:hypothetical protein [Actinomadura rubteroloni]POM22628.1 Serine/threonine-protein kinase AfsK [Actinomadura rubteroloni]
MSAPLPPGDPGVLGPFRLSARLSESAAGIVFVGVDGAGRRASVAVLSSGAAEDAAARDRFRAAIRAELPGGPGESSGGAAPVVAAQPDGPAPWVATEFDTARAGAERFLRAVLLGAVDGPRHGPGFRPHWQGSQPALAPPPVPVRVPVVPEGGRPERGLVAATLTLVAVLGVLGLLLAVLFACEPKASPPPPPPPEPTMSVPQQPAPGTTPEPSPPPGSPVPPGTPGPGDGGGGPL